MKLVHLQVLCILFLAALLIFFSSFITLDHHVVGERASILAQSRQVSVPTPTAETMRESKARNSIPAKQKEKSHAQVEVNKRLMISPTLNRGEPIYKSVVKNVLLSNEPQTPIKISTRNRHWPLDDPARCYINQTSKCRISRWIHYWNDRTDCFVSPLREKNGLSAPREQQKFVVFQPDLGGWNK